MMQTIFSSDDVYEDLYAVSIDSGYHSATFCPGDDRYHCHYYDYDGYSTLVLIHAGPNTGEMYDTVTPENVVNGM